MQAEKYEVIFSEGRAEFRRCDYDIDTHTEVVVSPEDDIELRRVKLTNRTNTNRMIDVTSYAQVVLALNGYDLPHPAFSNLFVQTEIIQQRQAILCTRRPRSEEENPPWMFHLMEVHGAEIRNSSFETDRMRFIGRGNTLESTAAMANLSPLSGSQGSVLDPVVAIQSQIILIPEGTFTIDMETGISASREEALTLVEKYPDKQIANRVFELAWTHSQVVLRQINANETDAQLYGRLASSIIYANYHEFRLAPWNNDPVTDSGGEAMYIRDEDTGHYWSPTPLTKNESTLYLSRHGFGYSVFEHDEGGIISELCVYVATDASMKFSGLKVRNKSGRLCKLSAISYAEVTYSPSL